MKIMILYDYTTYSPKQFLFTTNSNKLHYTQVVNIGYKKTPMEPQISPHRFRHTHCSLLFKSRALIKEVQKRLGFKNIKSTMNIYAHVSPEKIEETGERFANYVNF